MEMTKTPRHVFDRLLLGALLLFSTPSWPASSFDDLRKKYPDFARLLTLAAPKSGLSKEQLDKAFDNIARWALGSKSQAGQDNIDLLVDKGRLDYLEAMRDAARKIKVDGDASDWPEWSCLWKASDSVEPLRDTDVTYFRALFDGERLGIAFDLPKRNAIGARQQYWIHVDCVDGDDFEFSVILQADGRSYWQHVGPQAAPLPLQAYVAVGGVIEAILPPAITRQFQKDTVVLRLVGPRRPDQSLQRLDVSLPVGAGIDAAKQLMQYADTKAMTASTALPEAVRASLRESRGNLALVRRVGDVFVLLDDGGISRPLEPGKNVHPGAVGRTGFDIRLATQDLLNGCQYTPLRPSTPRALRLHCVLPEFPRLPEATCPTPVWREEQLLSACQDDGARNVEPEA